MHEVERQYAFVALRFLVRRVLTQDISSGVRAVYAFNRAVHRQVVRHSIQSIPKKGPAVKFFFRMINPFVAWLLQSRLHGLISFQLMVLEITGRRSGRIFRIPVSYAKQSDDLICLTLGENLWWRNLLDCSSATLIYKGQRQLAPVQVVANDAANIEAQMRMLIAHNPIDAFFAGIRLNFKLEPNAADLTVAATRHVVLRFGLAEASSSAAN